MSLLESINTPEDLKALDEDQLNPLCAEIRKFLIDNIACTGGHLASNLGVVELLIGVHRIYDTATDRLVFDVGHQSYVHKIITGRRRGFDRLRHFGGLSGFPKPAESIHDSFIAGHASNAISVALGMARARTIAGASYDVVALVGDGAMTGGLSYEGLSDAGGSGEPLVVILNDNGMSIEENVGGMAGFLEKQRVKPSYISFKRSFARAVGKSSLIYNIAHRTKEGVKELLLHRTIFEELGFYYLGPVDGGNIQSLCTALDWARELGKPVLVHVITQKGKGYPFAERDPESFHGVGQYDTCTGEIQSSDKDFSTLFGETMTRLAGEDRRLVAVTAAMAANTGLSEFARQYPRRFFDVGIAEGHGVSMSAGMAKQGLKPVFAVYSTFLQRGYDMLIHDVALQNLPVTLAVDRGGLVGADGETHQGVFDVSYLSSVPNMTIYCPSSFAELEQMLQEALDREEGPVAIRYPRGGQGEYTSLSRGPSQRIIPGDDVTIVSYGIMINQVMDAARRLGERGVSAEVVKLNQISPLRLERVLESAAKTRRLVVTEDVCRAGCVGLSILAALAAGGITLTHSALLNLGDGIVAHGAAGELMAHEGIDAAAITEAALSFQIKDDNQNEKSKT